MKIYGDRQSGNCLKVVYTSEHLGLPFDWHDVDILNGESRTPDFLAINPHGQVPVVQFDDGRRLAQSNAILRFLSRGSTLLPDDPFTQAKIDEWLFWEQYSHEPYIAVVRYWHHFIWDQVQGDAYLERALEERTAKGYVALDVMEQHLAKADFFAGGTYSVADIALYAYTHVAHEGQFELSGYPAIRRWLDRVADQSGHVLISQEDFA